MSSSCNKWSKMKYLRHTCILRIICYRESRVVVQLHVTIKLKNVVTFIKQLISPDIDVNCHVIILPPSQCLLFKIAHRAGLKRTISPIQSSIGHVMGKCLVEFYTLFSLVFHYLYMDTSFLSLLSSYTYI